ncbi:hypothetical protein N781_12080 [Pontibacillus halophilus JSM 076056 = DSM 19796]|uniref:Flagellar Assembly Protein A N-terminal region domain-containing protein n=1 Tax=Pontibacillus halophilus JSM 076056 = DSM 19796 TaxID=1385510 RepID=A0A0A5GMU9_9BACI|nr:FapA family protein [Pontibacillus halophilus]KGX93324.1 hypothetical protein N781_12080 [Pontibacillus halophilus JSM 076056 = DSM 19796]
MEEQAVEKGDLHQYFKIEVDSSRIYASLSMRKPLTTELQWKWSQEEVTEFLEANHIVYGMIEESLERLRNGTLSEEDFPLDLAKGQEPMHGEHGSVTYHIQSDEPISYEEGEPMDFREVMRIPSLNKGDKILTIKPPTDGEPGVNVHNVVIPAVPGKLVKLQPGKNVRLDDVNHSMYATEDGQVSVGPRLVQVHNVYQVDEDISMKVGNLDFVGTIVIKGNVPTGYTIKAGGDIHVNGLVEGATLIAEGSIYISEGVAATGKGGVYAKGDVHSGYINQGYVEADHNIFVEKAIIHSECIASENVHCTYGNIFGGSVSAGKKVESKDVGNKMNTHTEIFFGTNKKVVERELYLSSKKAELEDMIVKLRKLGDALQLKEKQTGALIGKDRITKLRQKSSLHNSEQLLEKVTEEWEELQQAFGDMAQSMLETSGVLHGQVTIAFGKYKRTTTHSISHATVRMEDGEIHID